MPRTRARGAMTAPFGPTQTASSGSTWSLRDGLMWLRFKFKAAARRKTRSGMGPDLDVRSIPSDRVGPLQGVRVAPCRAVLTTRARNREPAADAKADDTDLARIRPGRPARCAPLPAPSSKNPRFSRYSDG